MGNFTKYKNKIGLQTNNRYLLQGNDVVLAWAYKDTVLEGGQNHEENTREELFFHETIDQEAINQLFEPKVLTRGRRHTAEGEKPLTAFRQNTSGTITDNLIIKGNNLLALYSLLPRFTEKIKLIYIDPPYNTGNDGFKYNDNFSHSTWLTFMKNRLEVAKKLLRKDGIIFVQTDDTEHAYLKVLMDEIFGRENFLANIVWRKRAGGGNDSKHLAVEHEHILFYQKDSAVTFGIKRQKTNHYKKDKNGYYLVKPLNDTALQDSKGLHYDIMTPDGTVLKAGDHQWKMTEQKFKAKLAADAIIFRKGKVYYKHYVDIHKNVLPTSIFYDVALNSRATKEQKYLFGAKVFNNPKPEALIRRLLEFTTQKGDIVLDYHLGSGTTAAVAHKMQRQYIGIEQMDYIGDVAVARLKKVIGTKTKTGFKDYDEGGISGEENWQGGGEFVYFELKKYNQTFIENIQKAQSAKALKSIWLTMKEKSFLDYHVDIEAMEKAVNDFHASDLQRQKQFLTGILDKNQLYVNLSSLRDKDFAVSEEDKRLTEDFYGTSSQL